MPKYFVTSLALSIAYFLTGWLGLSMPAVGTAVTLIWLPTGIAVACLYRAGFRYWPAVTIGSLAVNLVFGKPLLIAIGISGGNTLGPMLAVWLLHRWRFDSRFERNRDIVILAAAAHAGMMVSSTNGIAVLVISGLLSHETVTAWLCWWAGDSMGVIAATPLIMVANHSAFRSIRARGPEFASWLLLLIAFTLIVFVANGRHLSPALPLAFVPLAFIPWGTMRFGTMGTSLAIILISTGAVCGTSSQAGPFFRSDISVQIFLLWIYMATSAILGWSVASLRLAQVRVTSYQTTLEKALGEVSLGVLMTDISQNVTYMNVGFTRLTGYEESDLLGKNCRILQGTETARDVVAKIRSDLEQSGHFDGEILNYRKDGTSFWNALLITTIHDDIGQSIGFLGIQRNITAKKEAILALQQSESHLRSILDLEPDCVKIVSKDGRLLEMNSAGLSMIEADSIEQVRGALLEELILEEHRLQFRRMHRQAIAGTGGHLEFAVRGLKGTHRWLESHCVPYRNIDGTVIGLLGVTRDITERRLADEKLRASEARYRELFKANPQPMWVYDLETLKFLAVNNAAVQHYGYSRDEFLAMSIQSIRPAEDLPLLMDNLSKKSTGIETSGTWRHSLKNGQNIKVEVASHALTFDGRPSKLVLVIDVTERLRLEEQAARERAVLEMLASGELLSDVLCEVARNSERICPGMMCSILLLDESGQHLRHAAAPALPVDYCRAIDGGRIGPNAGSCGTAAYTRKNVIVTDIATDSRWVDYREFALKHGLKACWSVPMISSGDKVLGTLAMYYSEPRTPSVHEIKAIERVAYLAVLAVERHQLIASLRDSRVQLETLVSNLPGMAFRCQNDSNWTMIYVSDGCEMVTGYKPQDLIANADRCYADLVHPDDRNWLWEKCRATIAAGTSCRNVYRIFDKHGRIRWVLKSASGVLAEDGSLKSIDGFIQDVTESRQIEENMIASLSEKEAMLKEIHHRVKNNLQIVSSLLNLQLEEIDDPKTLDALRESQNRVRSMALVHETLYRSGNLGRIDMVAYVNALCSHLFRSFGIDPSRIQLTLNVINRSLDLDRAIPLGLITNELVSNALKYAFPDARSGTIRVDFSVLPENAYELVVSDDGIGLPESLDVSHLKSLGLQLTRDLTKQLSGTLTIAHSPGTVFRISFPLLTTDDQG